MPVYFIDFHDGQTIIRDDQGCCYIDVNQAGLEAVGTLQQIFKDNPIPVKDCLLTSTVRDDQGKIVFRASIDFKSEFLSPLS